MTAAAVVFTGIASTVSKRRRIRVKDEFKSAAVLTVKDADKMTAKGRAQIAAWLRKQADAIQAEGHNYASRFRARYLSR